jgi:hypothetical protein
MPDNRAREYLLWALLSAVFAFLAFAYAAVALLGSNASISQSDIAWALAWGIANSIGFIVAMRRRRNTLVNQKNKE